MKKRMITTLALLLALAMLLASCGTKDSGTSTGTTTLTTSGQNNTEDPSAKDTHGLYADYYTGVDFKKYVTSERVDSLDLIYESGKAPASKVSRSHYSIRFSGRILTKGAGVYTFTTYADDGAVLYVNGQQVIYDAGPHTPTYTSGSIELEGQTAYDICLEYYNGDLGGTIQLLWENEDFARETVPAENLLMPEKAVEVSMSHSGDSQTASAMMRAFNSDEYTLVLERHGSDGALLDTLSASREGKNVWSITDTPDNTDITYTAYVTDKEGNTVSNAVTQKFGADYSLTIDPERTNGGVSELLYGACMEDVNHELYGGIWSQMIFGESFEEPATVKDGAFAPAGGAWYTDGEGTLCIDNTANGPKLLITDTSCKEGYIEADVYIDGEVGGFLIKTTDAKEGADNFNGYEISLGSNFVRLGEHRYNYANISDTNCSAPLRTWVHLRVEFTENSITVFVNGSKVTAYTDSTPLTVGALGFRTWNASAKFKNVTVSVNGEEKAVSFEELNKGFAVSGMWDAQMSDGIDGYTSVITDNVYSGKQAQRLTFTSGKGTLSLNNMGLNRGGMGFVGNKDYNGYIYASSKSPITVYVALESADGSTRYAETSFTVEGEYKKYSFSMTPDTTDAKGRFTIELREAGELDVDYAFLETGEWGLYKGLHVRADVGQALEDQGITVLRFGGCMANAADYKWKFMTGAPEDRGVYRGWWYDYSSYGFGVVEFMDLSEALGVTYIPDFSSYESAEDMADFAQFAFGTDPENEWVKLRVQMGRDEPYNLKYIQVGNEDKVDLAFANRFNAIANAVWQINPDVVFIVGDFEYKNVITDPYSFTGNTSGITSLEGHERILKNAAEKGKTVWFDIHFWSESGKDPYHFYEPALSLYNALHTIVPEANSALCVLELNANAHHFERALCNALAIKFAEEHSDIIKIMCSANALQVQDHNDNGWNQGLIFMDTDSVWYQAPAYIDRIFLDAYLPVSLEIEGEGIKNAQFDISATASEDKKTVCVKVLNRSGEDKGVNILIEDFASKNVTMTLVEYSDSMSAVNTNSNPENTKPSEPVVSEILTEDGELLVSVKGYSVTLITLTIE